MTLKTTLKLTAAAASLAILAGCASNAALDEVRQTAESAQADAAEARSIATQAQNTANQAQRDAQAALQMSEQNRDEMNRMFQRSMQK
ncbi:Lpp/OprI family alanine-zipper lipoprotein [Halomonas sp. E19]|uniref:Lpp/OprI family alanine-zipper lipoprotein n=1 Tax=unclassified Halomonas TaxID=2609666 RepID=UPI0040344A80